MTGDSIRSVRLPNAVYRTNLRKAINRLPIEADDFDLEGWVGRALARRANRYRRDPDRATVSATGASAFRFDFPAAALFPFGQRGELLRARAPTLRRPKPLTIAVALGASGGGAFQPEARNPAPTED